MFDDVAEVRCSFNGGGSNIANTLHRHCVRRNLRMECQLSQDLEFLSRIVSVNIERGIGLRETFGLRLTEGSVEADTIFGHAGQNEIASAVENTAQALNAVPDQSIPQSPYDGNASADAGFKSEPNFASFRRLHQAEPIQRKQRLIGGHDMFSAGE